MKLIGAGLPRTATTTQKVALEMLGLSTYHMVDLMGNLPSHLELWNRADDGEDVWDQLLTGKDATVDWPGARYYAPLLDKYPDAPVLLSVRDPDSWARSMQDTICQIYFGDHMMHRLSDARILIDENWAKWIRMMYRMCWDPGAPLADAPETTEGLIRSYKAWEDEVKSTVPADRLLVWEPKEGWAPICELLGVPVPDAEFPNVNDAAGFKQGIMGGAMRVINDWWDSNQPGVAATTVS